MGLLTTRIASSKRQGGAWVSLHTHATFAAAQSMQKHPIVSNQQNRPKQPTADLTSREVEHCTRTFQRFGWQSSTPESIVVLTYLTDIVRGQPWVLGLSAALHKMPLVIAGYGMQWDGAVKIKIPAAMRAIQALYAFRPQTTILFADGSDTAICNAPSKAMAALSQIVPMPRRNTTVLFSGECGSWPKCYRKEYEKVNAHRVCRSVSHACYPNSGAYLGTPVALMRMLPRLKQLLITGQGVELNDDQAAANRLLLSTSDELNPIVDYHSDVFLSLYGCKEPRLRTFMKNYTLCKQVQTVP